MKNLTAFILFVLFVSNSFGQQKCDCSTKDAFIRTRDFEAIATYIKQDLTKESRVFSSQKNAGCKAYGVHLKGVLALQQGKFEEAKLHFDREKYLLDSLRCKPINYIENNIGLGDYFLRVGSFESAIEAYTKTLKPLRRAENKSLQAYVLLSLSNAHSKLNQEEKALKLLETAYPLVLLLPNGKGKVDRLFDLSSRYFYHSEASSISAFIDSAHNTTVFGLSLARSIGYTDAFIKGYNLLEDKEYQEKNYRKALVYLDSALLFATSSELINERYGIYSDMADIYLELKSYEKAYSCADSSLSYALLMGNPYKVKNALELVYNCSKLDGEYERALSVYQDLVIMRDSLLRIQNNKAFNELEDKYHRVRKEKSESEYEQDRKLLTQQRQIGNLKSKLITVGSVIAALLLCYILIIFRQKNIRQKQKKLEVEQRLQQARINPEFIYTALQNFQKLATSTSSTGSETSAADIAKKMSSFSKLMKQTLESSHDDFLTLDKEIEFVQFYMDLQRDKLKQSFTYSFQIDEQINSASICLPTMILQPFLENTIEHGFKGITHEGTISLSFVTSMENNELIITIQDNGKGLKAVSSTRATEIINDRFYLLNKMNKSSSSYLIRERNSGGVSVEIHLPLITKEMVNSNV